ncbi:hypothetical protein SAMN05660776_2584 [Salegentibacter holothuriorum]|uniref:Uncharacterized protein n=1 Tax=Salegentibacter holothuriorum TaxID=241145 RepID=A0A1T5DF55_9FLAO|nr:hypothetical protein SAMN05660776_2584 [Salegentibacter holothuriorum]
MANGFLIFVFLPWVDFFLVFVEAGVFFFNMSRALVVNYLWDFGVSYLSFLLMISVFFYLDLLGFPYPCQAVVTLVGLFVARLIALGFPLLLKAFIYFFGESLSFDLSFIPLRLFLPILCLYKLEFLFSYIVLALVRALFVLFLASLVFLGFALVVVLLVTLVLYKVVPCFGWLVIWVAF